MGVKIDCMMDERQGFLILHLLYKCGLLGANHRSFGWRTFLMAPSRTLHLGSFTFGHLVNVICRTYSLYLSRDSRMQLYFEKSSGFVLKTW
jgi:hypothetical protein